MKKAKIIVLSIITTLCLYSERLLKEMVLISQEIKNINIKELAKSSYTNIDFLLILILTIALISFYNKHKNIEHKKGYNILSAILTLFLIFGYSYSVIGSSKLITGNFILLAISVIKFITYYIFLSTIINCLSSKITKIDLKKIKLPKLIQKYEKFSEAHPIKATIIVLLIAWFPYIISFYPAILSPDPANQIKQYFNMETHYSTDVKLVDPNVLITNHHPVFHTFILGGFAKIGYNLGNINFGLFLFTCFQLFVVISAIAYMLYYLKKLKIPFIYRFTILLIFALVPVFPLYALSPVKDTFFGALLIFFIIELHRLITSKAYSKKDFFGLCLLMLIMMLTRNNGIYIVMFSIIPLIFLLRKRRLGIIIVILSSLFIYVSHNKVLLPAMHITPGSIREVLSVPFQQTARYIKYYGDELSSEEIATIDKILNYDTIASRYKPNIADPIKNEFNPETTKEDLIAYFKVWFVSFFKHPGVYVDATINTIYGYFYPNTTNWYVYHNYNPILKESGLDYHFNSLNISRQILGGYGVAFPYIPLLGSIVNIGFTVWIYLYLLTYLIVEHKRKFIVLLLPALTLLLTCVVGPVNTYFRYMIPIVMSLPLIIGLIYYEKNSSI